MTRARRAPASVGQASLWFLRQWMPYKSPYNTAVRFLLEGALDTAALEAALHEVVRRHESLRTTFAVTDGTVSQVIHEALDPDVRTLDVSSAPDPGASAEHLARSAAAEPFDLERGPLFRARILRTAPAEHVLCVIMDHIVADGMSLGILWRELEALYTTFRAGEPPALPAPPKQYAACVEAQEQWLATPAFARQLRYWTEHLAGAVPCDLPADRSRPAVRSFRGDLVISHLSPERTAGLRALAEREAVSPFAVLLAVLFVLLARSSGQRDVSVMIPVACRQRFDAEHVVGFFANMVVLRVLVPDRLPFRALLQRVSKEITAGLFRQDVPFEKVIEALHPDRSLSHDPVTSVALSFLPEHGGRLDLPGITATYGEIPTGGSKFDLHLVASEHGDDLMCSAEYNGDIFERTTTEALVERFRRLLGSAIEAPDRACGDLGWLSPDEVSRIVSAWNETSAAYGRGATVHGLVAAAAARAPAAVAVSFEGDEIDHGTLDRRSNRVARALKARGAGPGVRVGIAVERSVAMVVGLLGILKSGSAYVPLDPSYPRGRLALMAEDSGMHVLVTEDRLVGLVPAPAGGQLRLDGDAAEIEATSGEPLDVAVHPESIAYVLYTSGSTGRPKGVEVPHRAVVNFLTTMAERPGLSEDDRLLAVTSLSFDIAGLELWLPLVVGAQVEIASRETAGDGAALRRHLDAGRITVMQATPATFRLLLEAGWRGRHPVRLLVGGEAVPPDLAEQLAERSDAVWNMYGPTETTIWSCIHRLSKGAPVLVGRPIANTRTYVLDRGLHPVPPGVTGELYIGGDGVARGYLGRPELTAERFVPDPFSSSGGRLYRTGDLARQKADGAIELLGRVDFQVKIRGHRIELGEIEAALAAHASVRSAVVIAREEAPGDQKLVAYVTVGAEGAQALADPRAHLRTRLPETMIPSAIVVLDAIPLLPNGKIDRGALPSPWQGQVKEAAFVAPRTTVEELLAGVWADLLGLPRVSVVDDFFGLGGHSLLGMRVLSRVAAAFGVELPLRVLFEARTVAAMAERIEAARAGDARPPSPPIARVERSGAPLRLSFAQQRLWFLDRLEPKSAVYNIPAAVRIEGALDVPALERSLAEIVRRHEALRTTFATEGGEPRQVIAPAGAAFSLPVVDLSALPAAEREAEARRRADAEAQEPFDLAAGPLFRALLIRLSGESHVLVVNMHHVVSDGWSEGVLRRELSALYEAFASGRPSPLPELPVQVADHAAWQRAWLSTEALGAQIGYWKAALGGAPPALDLPADRPRPPLQSYAGTTHPIRIPRALTDALSRLARREGVTLFMALLAVFQAVLRRWTGQRDVVVGSPTAGRTRAEIEGLIGCFVNTLVLRTDLGGDPTVHELLARVREVTLEAYAHQDVPFEKLVEVLSPPRDLSRSPLFQVMLIVQNAPSAPLSLGPAVVRPFEIERGTSKVDLTMWLEETGEGLEGFFEYPTALFDAATVARMAGHFQVLLEGAVADPGRRLSQLGILTGEEREALLVTWNATARPYPADACVHTLVEARARAAPSAVAVSFEGRTLRYGELDARANRLARALASRGARRGSLVGLAMDRSPDLVVGLLGILKAGAAYVPLDPTYPPDRLAFMLDDAGIALLVTEEALRARLPDHRAEVVLLDAVGDDLEGDATDLPERVTPEDRAYVIYTSGSTGKPKGVEIPHRAVVNFLVSMADRPGLSPSDRMLAVTSLSFDIAGLELWLPLAVGASVEIASRETAADGAALRRLVEAGGTTAMQATPTTYRLLIAAGWKRDPALKVLVGGEPVPPELASQLLERASSVWDMYGPTETTIWSTVHRLEKDAPVLIGRPIANTRTYVLDEDLSPVPAGVTGELYIGGAGLAHGYLGRPELTAERFVPDPFVAGERLYRTGDRCRQHANGALEHLGRADFQVKLRGYRIELGEIEAVLGRHPSVREAVVVVREDTPGEPRLVAYVTVAGEAAPSAAELRAHVRAELPEYMAPASLMVLERLPLTANNKIDRRALPRPEVAAGTGDARPRGALELKLRAIWEEVLQVERVGMEDSFFDLGGHSLLALQLFDRIERALGLKLPVTALFQAPTIEKLGELLRREGWQPSWSSLVAIQIDGSLTPFFCVHAVGGNVLNYRLLSGYLGAERPFYGLQSRGLGGNEAPHETVEAMAAAYIAEIRTAQARGPYLIGGASSGGVIAYEMAQQLHAAGEQVGVLVLMDTTLAGSLHPPAAQALARHYAGMMVDYHLGHLLLRTRREGLRYLLSRVEARLRGTSAPVVEAVKAAPAAVRHVYEANLRALERYVPRPYPGRAVMLLSRDEPGRTFYDDRLGWADLVEGGLTVRFIPGDHQNMLDEPQVAGVAEVLARCLEGV